ncbi:MAG: aminotransferase class I/II-fold pyridoxal phosphate-dependent enzyme [Pseudomonadota bacterium]|nr:aminotransferase class I/II-fold pyridoxal phosphate-dependent enzyme [Pseudomonadota bacterium]
MKSEYIRVPYGSTVHGPDEIEAVVKVLNTSTQMGSKTKEFESEVSRLFNKEFGLMVNSGSSALYLAIESIGLEKDSEVITPVLTFATTVGSLVKNSLIPVFVDVSPNTYCINTDLVQEKVSEKTKAILAPNLIGNICEWHKLREIADKNNLILIEDSADTLGATLNGTSTGSFCDLSITSFYGSHIINGAGNGGMLCTSIKSVYEKAKLLRSWGRSSSLFSNSESIEDRFKVNLEGIDYDAKFVFEEIGYQLESSEISAAFALIQLKNLSNNIKRRQEIFEKHTKFLSHYSQWISLPQQTVSSYTGWLAYPIVISEKAPFTRRELQIFLENRNIQTRVVFTGNILRQPGFKSINCVGKADEFEVADEVMKGGMLMACHHGLTEEHLQHIHDSMKIFFSDYQ